MKSKQIILNIVVHDMSLAPFFSQCTVYGKVELWNSLASNHLVALSMTNDDDDEKWLWCAALSSTHNFFQFKIQDLVIVPHFGYLVLDGELMPISGYVVRLSNVCFLFLHELMAYIRDTTRGTEHGVSNEKISEISNDIPICMIEVVWWCIWNFNELFQNYLLLLFTKSFFFLFALRSETSPKWE